MLISLRFIKVFLLVFLLGQASLLAQELTTMEERLLRAESVALIEEYFKNLPQTIRELNDSVTVWDLDDEGEEVEIQTTTQQGFIDRYFENNDVYVFNDLSPDGQESSGNQRVLTIDEYLARMKDYYSKDKEGPLELSVIEAQVEDIQYNEQAVEKFYFVKIKVKRKLSGTYLGKTYTENFLEYDFFVKTLDKPDTRLKDFIIIGTDKESTQINVGDIGVENAMSRGIRYYNEGDYDRAFQYLIKYKDDKKLKKNTNATWALGSMFFWGQGTKRSDEEMLKWLNMAVDRNHPYALFWLGQNYYYGEYGVDEDEKLALKLMKKSARKDYSEAEFFMGQQYETGELVRQSDKAAKRWYKRAEKQGHVKAKYALKKLESKG